MLHENLGEAHRKHAYQLMANELNMSHPVVSLVYMVLQLAVSLVMVYALPDRVLVHWVYLGIVIALLAVVYLLFMRKYYHLVDRTDQAGVVHERVSGTVVGTETEGMGAQLDACAFPPDVGAAVGGETEIVVMLAGEITSSPGRSSVPPPLPADSLEASFLGT